MKITIKGLMGGRAAKYLAAILSLTLGWSAQAAEYLVKYKSEKVYSTLSQSHFSIMDAHPVGKLVKIDVQGNDEKEKVAKLMMDKNVEYVVPNFELHAFTAPVNPNALKDQWAIAKVQAEAAWKKAGNKGSKNVLLAVIDTGVDYKHQNLASNSVPGFDFVRNNNDPMDITSKENPGHGTHCAGIIGANGSVDGGTIGISPELSIMPLRFLDEKGRGDLNNGIKAIDYAISKNVQIISASWGAAVPRNTAKPLIEAIERAEKAGIVFVAAAANDGKNNDTYEVYPANAGVNNMIVVAASGNADAKPSWSNYGKRSVHIASPGEGIMSTLPQDKYGNLSGTSMATPLVAGLVAFIKAQDPSLTAPQLRSILQASADKVGIETACDCRINASNAVDLVQAKKMTVVPYTATVKIGDKVGFSAVYGKAPFTFVSANPSIAAIDAQGNLTGAAEGETAVEVTDSAGVKASSYKVYVGTAKPDPGDPGDGGECMGLDPMWCEILCQIMPDAPFCSM